MSFKESLHVVCFDMILAAVVPSWASWAMSEREDTRARYRSYV